MLPPLPVSVCFSFFLTYAAPSGAPSLVPVSSPHIHAASRQLGRWVRQALSLLATPSRVSPMGGWGPRRETGGATALSQGSQDTLAEEELVPKPSSPDTGGRKGTPGGEHSLGKGVEGPHAQVRAG